MPTREEVLTALVLARQSRLDRISTDQPTEMVDVFIDSLLDQLTLAGEPCV
jgi:hypothetical protein